MSEVLQANIFFMITAIAVVVMTIFICVVLYQVIRILRAIQRIAMRVEEGSKVIAEDAAQLRAELLNGNFISSFFSRFVPGTGRGRKRSKQDDADDM